MKKRKFLTPVILAGCVVAFFLFKAEDRLKIEDFADLDLQQSIDKMYAHLEKRQSAAGLARAGEKPFDGVDDGVLQAAMTAAMNAYLPTEQIDVDGYSLVARRGFPDGLNASVFSDGNGVVIVAFRGTDGKEDVLSDVQIINGEMPEQFKNAQSVFEEFGKLYPTSKIVVAGHSLGGSLAQLVAANNPKAVAFACAPVGTGNVVKNNTGLADTGNVYNYLTKGDAFSNTLPQIGTSRLFETKQVQEHAFQPHSVLNCLNR